MGTGGETDRRTRWRNIAGVGVGVLLAVAFGASRLLGDFTAESVPTCAEAIAWDRAAEHVGETVAVEGPVAAVDTVPEVGGEPTFLNLGAAHPDTPRFDVVIYRDVREQFAEAPEDRFAEERVCVVGDVRERDGTPQVVLRSPVSIMVVDQQ